MSRPRTVDPWLTPAAAAEHMCMDLTTYLRHWKNGTFARFGAVESPTKRIRQSVCDKFSAQYRPDSKLSTEAIKDAEKRFRIARNEHARV